MDCRRSVVVHHVPHVQIFAARRCSCAWCTSVILWLLALIVPFIIAFCYNGWWFDEVNKVVLVAEKARLVSVRPAFASLTLQQIGNRTVPDKYPARRGEASRLVWMSGHPSLLIPLEADESSPEKLNIEAPMPVITVDVDGEEDDMVTLEVEWPLTSVQARKRPNHDGRADLANASHSQVTHCEIGLNVTYSLQSSPGTTFQSVAVVSEGSSIPASGLVLKGALMLQQHALLSDVHKESMTRQSARTNPAATTDSAEELATRIDDEQTFSLLASTTSAGWKYSRRGKETDRFSARASLKVLAQSVAHKPTAFEIFVKAWQVDEVLEDVPVRREIYNDLQHQYHICKSSLIRGFRWIEA
ncbi:hypothetical protein CSUI_006238 [Cystoisospora suis]|uniref:Transmembrane protein 231 n=1 Tax=Cystoisospora suis TaxID=483139 RepID=A0A2C6KV35_9APIC|nr:hypothetical protein CSUI_006238 [Cystoisospora suis]